MRHAHKNVAIENGQKADHNIYQHVLIYLYSIHLEKCNYQCIYLRAIITSFFLVFQTHEPNTVLLDHFSHLKAKLIPLSWKMGLCKTTLNYTINYV